MDSSSAGAGISVLDALESRYKTSLTKDDAEEMFLMSVRQRRVTIELVGQSKVEEKQKHLEDLSSASLLSSQISSIGPSGELAVAVPNMRELDLTGNRISHWNFVIRLCEELPLLRVLDLSSNTLALGDGPFTRLNLRTLVLNNCNISWKHVEIIKDSLPDLQELHLRHNNIRSIEDQLMGFPALHTINLEENCISEWDQVMKLSNMESLKHLNVNKNLLTKITLPEETSDKRPFRQLKCLLLGKNKIEEWESVDALDRFPSLVDVRLTENPITDTSKGGAPRYVLVARLSKVTTLNGSEVKPRERKDSEIRYVRSVLSTMSSTDEVRKPHPRFEYLKKLYAIDDESASRLTGPQSQNMGASLLSITLKCVAASLGEVAQVTKRLPGSVTVGKLKLICEVVFKLKATRQRLFLDDKESPLPFSLDDDMESLGSLGVGQNGVILVDEIVVVLLQSENNNLYYLVQRRLQGSDGASSESK